MALMNSVQFPRHLAEGIFLIYGTEYKEFPEVYSKFFEVDSSTKAYEEIDSMTGFGIAQQMSEGQPIPYDQAFPGYTKRFTHVEYGLGFTVTRNLWEDEQYRKIKGLPKALSKSMRTCIEIVHANILNNATSTSFLGSDGKALAATDHPLVAGGTFANKPTVDADLSPESLEAALLAIGDFVDDRGIIINARATKLVINPAGYFNAQRILKTAQMPGSDFNDINVLKGILPEPVVEPWQTDKDQWTLVTDVPNGLITFWRRRPEFSKDNDWETANGKFKTTGRFSCGWADPRCVYMNKG